jgi:hypothetical protein
MSYGLIYPCSLGVSIESRAYGAFILKVLVDLKYLRKEYVTEEDKISIVV